MLRINNRMKRARRKLTIIIGFILLGIVIVVADEFDVIAAAMRVGDAHGIAVHFDKNVDIKTEDKSITYSRNQGELVLREFFHNNMPRAFNIIHRGSSAKGAMYIIGTLETVHGNYRSFVYVKQISNKDLIEQMSFEKQ